MLGELQQFRMYSTFVLRRHFWALTRGYENDLGLVQTGLTIEVHVMVNMKNRLLRQDRCTVPEDWVRTKTTACRSYRHLLNVGYNANGGWSITHN
jgi:hypothetical protein